MNKLSYSAWLLGGLLVLPLVSGCGNRGPVRHEITGTVTYKGEPVEEGVIDFEPQDGQASKDGASIIKGEYRIPKDKGLLPGKYKVSIVIGDGTVGTGDASPDAPPRPRGATPGKERAPPEFNVKSTLIREVTADGPNKFDFAIP
jgi:hypothetical protein